MARLNCNAFLATALVFVNSAFADDGYGSVAGQIVFEGTIPPRQIRIQAGAAFNQFIVPEDVLDESLLIDQDSRGVANIFVWPAKVPSIHPRFQTRSQPFAQMTFDGLRVEPHCLLLQTSQKLRFDATSDTASTAHLRTFFNQGWNVLVPGKGEGGITLPPFQREERLPIRLTSNLQPWLEGWIKLSDHPYAALSDSNGNFQINWLPPGDYDFMLWHEKAGYLAKRLPVTVRDRKITRLERLKLTPKDVGIE